MDWLGFLLWRIVILGSVSVAGTTGRVVGAAVVDIGAVAPRYIVGTIDLGAHGAGCGTTEDFEALKIVEFLNGKRVLFHKSVI